MNSVLDQLVSLLNMETIEENLFRGASQDLAFASYLAAKSLAKRYQPPAKQSITLVKPILYMATFYARAMRRNLWCIKWNGYAMAAVLAHVASRPFKTVNRFSPAAHPSMNAKKAFVTKPQCPMYRHPRPHPRRSTLATHGYSVEQRKS